MKAVWFPSPNDVIVGTLPDPDPGRGEVLVRVKASGICHTDIEVMCGNYGTSTYPIVPGHEFAGEIAEVGADVSGISVGDRVVVDPNLQCGACRACLRGWAHLCENLGAYGVTVNGGFAECCTVRADAVHAIGDLTFAEAALAEPMGCVLNGLSPFQDRIVECAIIFGAGPMGLLMGLALKSRGTDEVIMVDRLEDRLGKAESVGLSAMNADADETARLTRSCDLAVDATGVPAVVGKLPEYVGNGGAVLIFGVCPSDARIAISPFEIFRRQLSLFGTHSLNHNIPDALELLKEIGGGVQKVVSHQLPIEEIATVMAGRHLPGSMKIQMAVQEMESQEIE